MARAKKELEKLNLEQTLEELNKTYGKGTVLSLEDKQEGEYEVISTGSIGMDYIVLGVGGVIKGKLYDIRAWEGAGKTTVAATITANCQKKGGKVAYIDGEHAVDKNYFQDLGVNVKDIIFCQPDYGEEGFDVCKKLIESGEIDLVIIDSDNSLIPKSAIDNPMGASNIGKKAFLNSNSYPKIKMALERNNCCMIVISQYREKIGVMFGDPKTVQGGHCLKYTADTIIELTKRLVKEGEETLANDVKAKTIKNKSFPPYRESRFNIVFGEGIDQIGEVIELGQEYGIISKSGSWYSYNGNKIGQGEVAVRELFRDNIEFFEEVKGKIIERIRNGVQYDVDEVVTEEPALNETI